MRLNALRCTNDYIRAPQRYAAMVRDPAAWRAAEDDAGRLRVVVDQVASLTDASAADWHVRLVRPATRGVGGAA